MSKIEGVEVLIVPSQWKAIPPEVGCYIGQELATANVATEYICPYCNGIMRRAIAPPGTMKRIVLLNRNKSDAWTGIAQVVPDTHDLIGCPRCRQAFTIPVRGER